MRPLRKYVALLSIFLTVGAFTANAGVTDLDPDGGKGGQFGAALTISDVTKVASSEGYSPQVPWIFVGCTRTIKKCQYMAEFHGYYRSSLRYDARLCVTHPHGACFAWRREGGNFWDL